MSKILIDDQLIEITPSIVAMLFSDMSSVQQAEFFNEVAEIATTYPFSMQMQYLTDEDGLTLAGRRVMQYIGEYSHWGLVPGIETVLENCDG